MKKNYSFDKNTTNILCFLCIFSSIGWVTDSGSFLSKTILLLFLIVVALFRAFRLGIIFPGNYILLPILFFATTSLIGVVFHGRDDDIGLLVKLIVSIFIVFVVYKNKFLASISVVFDRVFLLIFLGYIFQIAGISMPIPSFFLDSSRESYYITPALTVFRAGDVGRAYGFFWEPGALALFCNLSIISKIFWRNVFQIIDLKKELFVIFISMSLGGVIVAILIVTIGLSRYRRHVDFLFIFLFAIICVWLLGSADLFQDNIASMINILSVPVFGRDMFFDSSFNARIYDMILPFQVARDSLFFGNKSIDYLVSYSEAVRGQSENIITNSFGVVVYFYGYPCLIIFSLFASAFAFIFMGRSAFSAPLILFLIMFFEPVPFVVMIMVFFLIVFQRDWINDVGNCNC